MKYLIKKLLREALDRKLINQLKIDNKTTLPKIPVGKIYNNPMPSFNDIVRITGGGDGKEFDYEKVSNINLSDIVPTQKSVNIDNLISTQNTGQDTGAELVRYGDKYYIVDGHHRIANAILQNLGTISANVYDKNKENEKHNKKIT